MSTTHKYSSKVEFQALQELQIQMTEYVHRQAQIEELICNRLERLHGSVTRRSIKGNIKKYLFMTYHPGETLNDFMKKDGFEELLYPLAIRIIQKLREIHGMGFLHLDISSWNIIIHEHEITLIDFGCADLIDKPSPRFNPIRGTHIPPEIYSDHQIKNSCSYSHNTDIYAVGMVLYSLFTKDVFDAYQHCSFEEYQRSYNEYYIRALTVCESESETMPWKGLILRMIQEDPNQRIDLSSAEQYLSEFIEKTYNNQEIPSKRVIA